MAAEQATCQSKLCTMCKEQKDLSCFGLRRGRRGALTPKSWCKACRNQVSANWRRENPEKAAAAILSWERRNPDRVKAKRDKSNARMWAIPAHRLRARIGGQIRNLLGGSKARKSTVEILGYGTEELRAHIERQFLPGMSWNNMAKWHIDHIVPMTEFRISGIDDPELRRAWALTNLRPLWAFDNRSKKDKRLFLI